MTTARQRMLYGRTNNNMPSRFLEELPQESINWQGKTAPQSVNRWGEEAAAAGSPADGGVHGQPSSSRPSRQPRPRRDPGFTAPAKEPSAGLLQLEKGDLISHRTFGKGLVLSVRPMGNDALIEVAFDGVGTKKLMLKVAGAHITKL